MNYVLQAVSTPVFQVQCHSERKMETGVSKGIE
jgi:hypothetical protein